MTQQKPSLRQQRLARLHMGICAIELGILGHVEGSNESPHDGEHQHPWPCERMAAGFRDMNLHLSAANWRGDGPHAFFLDPETGDEWPIEAEASTGADAPPLLDVERLAHAAANIRNAPYGPHWLRRTEELLTEYARLADTPTERDAATRLRNWIAEHRTVCPIMRESARDLYAALNDELGATERDAETCQCGHTRAQHESRYDAPNHCTHRCLPPWSVGATEPDE